MCSSAVVGLEPPNVNVRCLNGQRPHVVHPCCDISHVTFCWFTMPRYDKQKRPIQPLYILLASHRMSYHQDSAPISHFFFCRISTFHQQYHQVYSHFHQTSLNKKRNDAGQVFGFDIMLDHKYKAFLLEASGDINDILTGNLWEDRQIVNTGCLETRWFHMTFLIPYLHGHLTFEVVISGHLTNPKRGTTKCQAGVLYTLKSLLK